MLRETILALALVAGAVAAAPGATSATSAAAGAKTVPPANGFTISGMVVDDGGRPVAGALVLLVEHKVYSQHIGQGILTLGAWESIKGFQNFRGTPERRTDAGGRFEFKGLEAGDYEAMALDAFLPQAISNRIAVLEGQAAKEVTLKLSRKPAGYLTGRLLKPDGSPLGAAEVQAAYLWRRWGGTGGGNMPVWTDSDGRYYVSIKPGGAWNFSLALPGYRLAEVAMEAVTPTKSYEQDFKLAAEKEDAEISGKVVMPDGRPAAGVLVAPLVLDQPWPGFNFMLFDKVYYVGDDQAAITGSDGTFHLAGLRPGFYGLLARTDRSPGAYFKMGPPRPELAGCCPAMAENVKVAESGRVSGVELRLTKGSKLTVTVTEAATGRPLAKSLVAIQPVEPQGVFGHRQGASVRTDALGRAQAEGLLPGAYNLTITAVKHQNLQLQKESAIVIEAGQDLDLKVPLPKAGEEPAKPEA